MVSRKLRSPPANANKRGVRGDCIEFVLDSRRRKRHFILELMHMPWPKNFGLQASANVDNVGLSGGYRTN